LVHTTSSSDDAETSMISKLKEACGHEYTNKLQRMFQDMQISKDLNTAFKEWSANNLDEDDRKKQIDSTYAILGQSSWPLQPPSTKFTAPADLVTDYERFTRFYTQKHQGRKLTWLWQLCKGELKATYMKAAKVPYTFQVSAFQMAILLPFNQNDTNSFEEIQALSEINEDILVSSIAIILKAKVLTSAGNKNGPGAVYSLNYEFKSKKIRVNLNLPIKADQKQEQEETHKTIEEDRKLLMQSVIVRIMKARKSMKHQQLVSEAIKQISARFQPKVGDIKKCIDILLEKEYLERLDDDMLGYLA